MHFFIWRDVNGEASWERMWGKQFSVAAKEATGIVRSQDDLEGVFLCLFGQEYRIIMIPKYSRWKNQTRDCRDFQRISSASIYDEVQSTSEQFLNCTLLQLVGLCTTSIFEGKNILWNTHGQAYSICLQFLTLKALLIGLLCICRRQLCHIGKICSCFKECSTDMAYISVSSP